MRDIEEDGQLQTTAGAVLVNQSRLVRWDSESLKFLPVPHKEFEQSWKKNIEPVFGRLMCWIQFSAGMEFWLKGLCLLNGVEFRRTKLVGKYPNVDIDEWAREYSERWESCGRMSITNYNTLGKLTDRSGNTQTSTLDEVMISRKVNEKDRQIVHAAAHFLAKTIRNRDAHSYTPNVRSAHHKLVPELFARCLNITSVWIPGGPSVLNDWIKDPKKLVAAASN